MWPLFSGQASAIQSANSAVNDYYQYEYIYSSIELLSTSGSQAGRARATKLLHEIGCDDVSVEDAIRLGKKQDVSDSATKPRPLKLVLASEDQKDKILYTGQKTWERRRTKD